MVPDTAPADRDEPERLGFSHGVLDCALGNTGSSCDRIEHQAAGAMGSDLVGDDLESGELGRGELGSHDRRHRPRGSKLAPSQERGLAVPGSLCLRASQYDSTPLPGCSRVQLSPAGLDGLGQMLSLVV